MAYFNCKITLKKRKYSPVLFVCLHCVLLEVLIYLSFQKKYCEFTFSQMFMHGLDDEELRAISKDIS